MSGRRRVKTIVYDEDDYWDGDSEDDFEEEEEEEEEYKCSSASSKRSGTCVQAAAKRGAPRSAAPHGNAFTKQSSSRGQQHQTAANPPKKAVVTSPTPKLSSSAASQPVTQRAASWAFQRNNSPASSSQGGGKGCTLGGAASRETEGSIKREAAVGICEQVVQKRDHLFRQSSSAKAGTSEGTLHPCFSRQSVGGGSSFNQTSVSQSSTTSLLAGASRPSLPRTTVDQVCEARSSGSPSEENPAKAHVETDTLAQAPAPILSAKASDKALSAVDDGGTQGGKSPFSIIVIGHVDAGKSTLTGQLLFRAGAVNERDVEKMKRMSATAGKGSFFFAWLCDEGDDERQRGVTIDVSCRVVVTAKEHRRISFLDAPGHRELVSNMLGGAVLADAALLVVDAAKFETGFEGQTKEHLLIVRSLNIQHFVVAVNKMDAVEWSEKAYNDVVERLRAFLTGPEIACPVTQIYFVPVSALVGVNVASEETSEQFQSRKCRGRRQTGSTDGQKKKRESVWNTEELERQTKFLRSWWRGPCLLDLLENIQINTPAAQRQLTDEPFTACVADMWSLSSSSEELNFSFKVASGAVSVGDEVTALPANVVLVCKALSSYGVATRSCASGDFVEKGVFSYTHSASAADKHTPSAGIEAVGVGTVLCSSTRLLRVVSTFLCKIIVFSRELPLMPGRQLVAYIHTMSCQCIVRRVVATINRRTGEVVKQKQARRCALVFGMAGVLEVDISPGKVCVRGKKEPHEQTSVLSRIILRDPTGTAAAGVVVDDVEV
eukprot:XP_028343334.1 HBS1-like protein [Physeter catodon]